MTGPVRPLHQEVAVLALIPDQSQWQEVLDAWDGARPGSALGCEWVTRFQGNKRIVAIHTGIDDISAAVSAQYAVDRWQPELLVAAHPMIVFSHIAERNGLPLADRDGMPVAEWIASL
ncbi:MAG TPA: hypothetical protein VES20_08780 [Bryobacteraceae bacterium]|nr:hypothetical protein [Bryobacteraceae bacterium]